MYSEYLRSLFGFFEFFFFYIREDFVRGGYFYLVWMDGWGLVRREECG